MAPVVHRDSWKSEVRVSVYKVDRKTRAELLRVAPTTPASVLRPARAAWLKHVQRDV